MRGPHLGTTTFELCSQISPIHVFRDISKNQISDIAAAASAGRKSRPSVEGGSGVAGGRGGGMGEEGIRIFQEVFIKVLCSLTHLWQPGKRNKYFFGGN